MVAPPSIPTIYTGARYQKETGFHKIGTRMVIFIGHTQGDLNIDEFKTGF
jgi:hypothetical protein